MANGSNADFDRIKFSNFDRIGRPGQRIDGNGAVTTYDYTVSATNLNSNLIAVNYPSLPSSNVTLNYGSFDRLSSTSNGEGVFGYSYDCLDNSLSEVTTYTGQTARTMSFSYFPDGSRQSMTHPGGTQNYLYDKAGRYVSMSMPWSATALVTSEYEVNGWQKKRTLPGGAKTDYTYNVIGNLTSLANTGPTGTILSNFNSFGYDGVFNLGSVTQSVVPPSAGNGFVGTSVFTYDEKDRLTQETGSRFNNYTENNVYDPAGNPTTFRNASGKTYNAANQLVGTAYNGNGSPTLNKTYDRENRLITNSSWSAAYRPDNLRAWTKTASYTGKQYKLYDGGNSVFEWGGEALNGSNVYAPDGLVFGGGYHLFDWQGSTAHVLSTTGSIQSHSAFNAWGQMNAVYPAPGGGLLRFNYNSRWGYVQDANGLYYCQNRYYDRIQGRWLTRDPIGYAGGINLYGYCQSGPVGAADPEGLFAQILAGAGVGAAADAISTGAMAYLSGADSKEILCEMLRAAIRGAVNGAAVSSGAAAGLGAAGMIGAGVAGTAVGDVLGQAAQQAAGCRETIDFAGTAQESAMSILGPCMKMAKVPKGWSRFPAKKGGGFKFKDPSNPDFTHIRIDPADANTPFWHVHVTKNGTTIDKFGNPSTIREDPLRHIPLEEWVKWPTWFSPK